MTIQVICASKDIHRASDFRRLLAAEGAHVDVVTRQLDASEEHPTCAIVLWSQKSVNSWPVIELARAAMTAKTLVQVALEPVRAPLPAQPAPIDFRDWNGSERGSDWRVLRERIESVQRGDTQTGAPFLATATLGVASLSILALAVSDRVSAGTPAEAFAEMEPFTPAQSQLVDAPQDGVGVVAVGGPMILAEPELEAPAGETGPEIRPLRLRPLQDLHTPRLRALPDISAPRAIAQARIEGPGFLRQLINGVEDTLPFLNVSEASSASDAAIAPPDAFGPISIR